MGGIKSAPLPGGGDSDLPGGGGEFPGAAPAPSPTAPSSLTGGGLGFLDGLSSGGLKLTAPVGPGAANDPGDVFRVESVLKAGDFLGRPPGRAFDNATFGAIKAAQARLNDDPRVDVGRSPLKLDGLVNPGGPTQAATRTLAGTAAETRRAPITPKPPRPSPAGSRAAPSAPSTLPDGETLEQTVRRFTAKKPLATGAPLATAAPAAQPTLRQRIAAMTGDRVAALERLAGGLRKVTHPGPVAKDIAGAFRGDGPGAAAEFTVVRDALAKSGTPEQVRNLTEGVRAELSPEDRGRFDNLLAGTDGGRNKPGSGQPPKPATFKVPAYRDQAIPRQDMDRFMGQHGQAKPNMRNALGQIFAAEGGFKDDRSGGTAHAGITDAALEQAKNIDPSLAGVARARDLTDEQVAKAYKAIFEDSLRRYGGTDALETIKDPKTAAAFADTLFMHGATGGAEIVKSATNRVIGELTPGQRRQLGVSELGGQTGPKDTLDAMRRLSNGGHGALLRKEIADRRTTRDLPPGAVKRINHFRFR